MHPLPFHPQIVRNLYLPALYSLNLPDVDLVAPACSSCHSGQNLEVFGSYFAKNEAYTELTVFVPRL